MIPVCCQAGSAAPQAASMNTGSVDRCLKPPSGIRHGSWFSLCPCGYDLSEWFCQRDNDSGRAANITQPVRVLILDDFTDELSPPGTQAPQDFINAVNGKHDAVQAQRVHRSVSQVCSGGCRRVEPV